MKPPIEMLFLFCLLVMFARALVTVLHELGHAIPLILMTKNNATIYIGTYGDKTKCLKINCGLLEIWAKYNLLLWFKGACVPAAKSISNTKTIIYILGGPLMSFLIACISISVLISRQQEDLFSTTLFAFAIVSVLDVGYNLTPNNKPIQLLNGNITHNDGYLLRTLFKNRKLPADYQKAVQLYSDKMYAESAVLFEEFLSNNKGNSNAFRYVISSFIQSKNFVKASEWSDRFIEKFEPNTNDYANAGYVCSQLQLIEQAIMFYDKSLKLNPQNVYSLNNKGYELGVLEKFNEALPLLNNAVKINPKFAHAYNNLGLTKIKTGSLEDGLKDILYSIELDPSNSYSYRNLGIYHLDKKEYDKALQQFMKTKGLDETTHNINELILEAQKFIT
jgi:tetratricopeptide (TPR) repeat protein